MGLDVNVAAAELLKAFHVVGVFEGVRVRLVELLLSLCARDLSLSVAPLWSEGATFWLPRALLT